jgi:hypothetical protein
MKHVSHSGYSEPLSPGITADQVGFVNCLRPLVSFMVTPLWGAAADASVGSGGALNPETPNADPRALNPEP